jgi:TolB protein
MTVTVAVLCGALSVLFVLLGSRLPADEIAFDSQRGSSFDIYLLDAARNITVRLTRSDADEYSPAWSPDGDYLAYVYQSDDDRAVYVMQSNGRSTRRLTGVTLLTMNPSLAWSPDGATLALATVDENIQSIFLIDSDGANLHRLSGVQGNAFTPTWSKDNQIAFSWSPVSNTEIWVMDVGEPESAHRITEHPLTDTSPAWSPDGYEIAFTSDRDGSTDIYLMNADGSDLRPLTYFPSLETMPTWSPNSERIAFVSNQTGNRDLFMMQSDGTGIQQLTFDGADDARPAWRP